MSLNVWFFLILQNGVQRKKKETCRLKMNASSVLFDVDCPFSLLAHNLVHTPPPFADTTQKTKNLTLGECLLVTSLSLHSQRSGCNLVSFTPDVVANFLSFDNSLTLFQFIGDVQFTSESQKKDVGFELHSVIVQWLLTVLEAMTTPNTSSPSSSIAEESHDTLKLLKLSLARKRTILDVYFMERFAKLPVFNVIRRKNQCVVHVMHVNGEMITERVGSKEDIVMNNACDDALQFFFLDK